MAKSLVIIGYGGHASEAAAIAIACGVEIAGFVDSEPEGKPDSLFGIPLLGSDDFLKGKEGEHVLHIGIGNNEGRKNVAEKYPDFEFATLIHPTAVVGPEVLIADGSLITPGSILTARMTIGKHVIINTGSIVSHDCVIGDYTNISPGCVLAGNVEIGEGTFLGCSVNCAPGVVIGAGSMIGIGSVVTKNIPDGVVAMGIPARVVKSKG